MTIGLPRALLYYKYQYLWKTFFEELGFQVVVSEDTNKKMLEDGVRFSIDECCLPTKIYMGHVHSLIGRCDYILVPRIESFGRNETVCVKFLAMYDIVKNTFKDAALLDYNVDAASGESELKGFIRMGEKLNKNYAQSLDAYQRAKRAKFVQDELSARAQADALRAPGEPKILLVAHPYNVYDKMLGYPVLRQIQDLGGTIVFADAADRRECLCSAGEISSRLYWTYNKELVGAINLFKDSVDGIVLMTAFPCGPDSLVNELILRRVKNVPIINILLDELQGEAGLQTRIESFMDIIQVKKKKVLKANG